MFSNYPGPVDETGTALDESSITRHLFFIERKRANLR
jgi:hypothetical protein